MASAWSGIPGAEKVYSTRHFRPTTQSGRLPITSGHGAPRLGSSTTVSRSSICISAQQLRGDQYVLACKSTGRLPPRQAALPRLLRAERRPAFAHRRLDREVHALGRREARLRGVRRLLADRDEPLLAEVLGREEGQVEDQLARAAQ